MYHDITSPQPSPPPPPPPPPSPPHPPPPHPPPPPPHPPSPHPPPPSPPPLLHVVRFNPVAHTVMMKLLERVANIECSANGRHDNYTKSLYHMPSKELMETISRNSKGDIRCAINSLQFACLRGTCVCVC